jgi:NAD(P)-dependent dehydrogenase (short-subunit alcohol dehydrogenase family)
MTQKTVLITGCSSGIGRLAAQTFQANGWNVIATMRTPEKETELNKLDNLLVARLDVTDSVSVEAAVAHGIERFEEIDVLVNNAGRGGRALLEQMSDEKIRDVFETNLFGAMRVTRAILSHMRKRGDGCVINVTSMAGVIGLAAETAYCSAKFAAEGFTESLYWECKPLGIKVKSVAPGVYRATSFGENVDDEAMEEGDEQLVAHARRLRQHFSNSADAAGGSTPADPQEVADRIFVCATQDTPLHNPVGTDADMIMSMMAAPPRQDFLDKLEPMILPSG